MLSDSLGEDFVFLEDAGGLSAEVSSALCALQGLAFSGGTS